MKVQTRFLAYFEQSTTSIFPLYSRGRKIRAKFFLVIFHVYQCKKYIFMTSYCSLSSQNRILNSANHRMKKCPNEQKMDFWTFLTYTDTCHPRNCQVIWFITRYFLGGMCVNQEPASLKYCPKHFLRKIDFLLRGRWWQLFPTFTRGKGSCQINIS